MDSMDEPRSPSLPTSPVASIIAFPSPSTLSSSSFSGQYGVQRNRGQLTAADEFPVRHVLDLDCEAQDEVRRLLDHAGHGEVRAEIARDVVGAAVAFRQGRFVADRYGFRRKVGEVQLIGLR